MRTRAFLQVSSSGPCLLGLTSWSVLGSQQVRCYHPMKKGLSTKKNVHKRFRLTPSGMLKFWPSQLSGKARFVTPTGNYKHLVHMLLPGDRASTSKWGQAKPEKRDAVEVMLAAMKRFKQVKGRDLTEQEKAQLLVAVKNARFEGNRVFPGVGQKPLAFD